eukprot:scaffold486_cov148-Skeletonema_dohrnii-CCMP3373.AAC.21
MKPRMSFNDASNLKELPAGTSLEDMKAMLQQQLAGMGTGGYHRMQLFSSKATGNTSVLLILYNHAFFIFIQITEDEIKKCPGKGMRNED